MLKVSKIPQTSTEDTLIFFFENTRKYGGGDIESISYDKRSSTAIITFAEDGGNLNTFNSSVKCLIMYAPWSLKLVVIMMGEVVFLFIGPFMLLLRICETLTESYQHGVLALLFFSHFCIKLSLGLHWKRKI